MINAGYTNNAVQHRASCDCDRYNHDQIRCYPANFSKIIEDSVGNLGLFWVNWRAGNRHPSGSLRHSHVIHTQPLSHECTSMRRGRHDRGI